MSENCLFLSGEENEKPELVVSTDGGPSSGVSQTITVQVCLRHRKPRTSEYAEEKRREHNLI